MGYLEDPANFHRVYDAERNSELVEETRDKGLYEALYIFNYGGLDFYVEGTRSFLETEKTLRIEIPKHKLRASFYQRNGAKIDGAQSQIDPSMLLALREAIAALEGRSTRERSIREGWRVVADFT